MKEQIIVTVGRQHGSGGHHIAKMIADQLNIAFYDREIVDKITEQTGYHPDIVSKMDEKPINFLFSRRIGEYSNSLEENVAEKTFLFLKELADSGKSFVAVGRCAEYVLRESPSLFRIFICGERETKIRRIAEAEKIPESKAADIIREIDRKRKSYHNYYCDTKWGDCRGYDLTINSSKLGLETTADLLTRYIRTFMEQ
jgi:cytidylate kinase